LHAVGCRVVASGRTALPALDDAFTVGWLAYHYPVVIDIRSSLIATWSELTTKLSRTPHAGIGFGWLRYVGRRNSLKLGTQLEKFPTYFNFVPRHAMAFQCLCDRTHLLPPAPEARLTMPGVGFVAEEFAEEIVLSASYDKRRVEPASVEIALAEVRSCVSAICSDHC